MAVESLATGLFIPAVLLFPYINPTVDTETSLAPVLFTGNQLQMKSYVLASIWMQQNGAGVLSRKSHNLMAGSCSRHGVVAAQISPANPMNFTLGQATKAQRGSRGITLFFL